MKTLHHLFINNRKWADSFDPGFFSKLSKQQTPEILWIGCSDSRVPANELLGLLPGEVFVHRNIANIVVHTDLNCLSVLHYAVDVLKVKHIIVCGHYGCGGVAASMTNKQYGLIDNWLRNLKDIYRSHRSQIEALPPPSDPNDPAGIKSGREGNTARCDLLCELNVARQVFNVCSTTIVQNAWARGQELNVHGWIYGLTDGLLRDLGLCIRGPAEVEEIYRVVEVKKEEAPQQNNVRADVKNSKKREERVKREGIQLPDLVVAEKMKDALLKEVKQTVTEVTVTGSGVRKIGTVNDREGWRKDGTNLVGDFRAKL
ncbi:hypothetical protein HK102_011671 [Quaeritorhiza haematococci]|nr:hypothetical protein HK102_011671 [Quaeritorhiza haematococci]